jgi:chromosome segregation ATPase
MSEVAFLRSHVVERSRNLGILNEQLEAKNARMREQLAACKRDAKKERAQHDKELGEAEVRMAGALATISDLKDTLEKEREQRRELVVAHNDKLLELQFVNAMRQDLEARHQALVELHDQVMRVLERAKNENAALRECNTRLLAEMKRLNKQLDE